MAAIGIAASSSSSSWRCSRCRDDGGLVRAGAGRVADVEPMAAMKASFVACLVNALLLLVTACSARAGGAGDDPLDSWLVLAPALAGSVYVSYVDIFGAPAPD
jgi:hypothetical protein